MGVKLPVLLTKYISMDYTALLVLIGRILYGGYFIMSGYNHFAHSGMLTGYAASKGVPNPKAAVLFTGLLLFLGGLGVLFGVFVNLAVVALVLFLVLTTFIMHRFWKITDPTMRMGEMINFKKNLALTGAALMFLAIPQPWLYSL